MSVYNPTGSGGVHTDRVISGGKGKPVATPAKKAAAKKLPPFMAKKAVPGKKAVAKKMPPGMKGMTDVFKVVKAAPKKGKAGGAMCAEPVKKTPGKAKAPMKAYGEVGIKSARQVQQGTTAAVRKSAKSKLPSQARIKPKGQPTVGKGTNKTSGSRMD